MKKAIYIILLSFVIFACTTTDDEEIEDFSGDSGTFVDSRDDNVYKWVRIGDQIWMAENLAYLPVVYPPASGSYTEPHYYVYDYIGSDTVAAKKNANYTTYGVLYNWPAAKIASPRGWHLPLEEEWVALQNYLITNGYNYDGTITDNKIGKSMAANTMWNISTNTGAIGNNLSSNNKSGFSALPGGLRNYIYGTFGGVGNFGYWWNITEYDSPNASSHYILNDGTSVSHFNANKAIGFSVRCVKD